jgi:outer membrane protein OmpA-like peptidoglycan-associated protein
MIKYIFSLLLILCSVTIYAQKDMDNCSDHPLFKRMPDTYIIQCSKGNDMIQVPLTDSTEDMVSGDRYFAEYGYHSANRAPAPKWAQIVNNYESEAVKLGGKKVYSSDSSGTAVFLVPQKGKELYLVLNNNASTAAGNYELIVVETDPSKKKVSALTILDDLSNKGYSILYFKFDNDKSIINNDSKGLIDVIVDLLSNETDLSISIESHTGNMASANEAQRISDNRAQTIYDAIVEKGIDKSRLKMKGWGASKPRFDNSSDKNDRIEIRKL